MSEPAPDAAESKQEQAVQTPAPVMEEPLQEPMEVAQPTDQLSPEKTEQQRKDEDHIFALLSRTSIRFPFTGTPIPPTWKVVERYPVNSPFAYAVISQSPLGAKRYFLDEVPLSKVEAGIYSYLLDALEAELTVPRGEVNPRQYFSDQARRILLKYNIRVPATSWSKIIYFAERDLVGFGSIDGILRDPQIEDVSIDAVGKPIFVYHKGHDSLETNVVLNDEDSQDNLITRLAHMAGKHISTAFPIVQGTLPGRHRLIATFRREVSPLGSSATIRKFREDPLTIVDMLNLKLIDHKMAAYAWLLMQNRATAIVVGATGAGKTTLMNALLTLTRLNTKIVTIEEVQEMNIPHQNWTSLVSRESYAATEERAGAVSLFDLVKAAMRMRPDILVVGEVRGEEAYVLFQAISTGHGGLCTLHADDASSAIQRLVSEPMNVPPAFLPFLDLVFVVRRISVPTPSGGFKSIRRIISVDEIVSEHEFAKTFRWDPKSDTYKGASLDKSPRLERIARDNGIEFREVLDEVDRRTVVLKWIQEKGIRNFKEVSPLLDFYVSSPQETYQRAVNDLQAKGVEVQQVGENRS
ncbi:MAG TPA: type II/IV secretion system ATPase subunit [Nitrososphaerales archaeon]|nr:type II/IV secretion system ATPase subunit [Nitrososphaerales archaeon]